MKLLCTNSVNSACKCSTACECVCSIGALISTHTLLLACAHHFTIMWTDLWTWGQMSVLNSITVKRCSGKINAPARPPPPPFTTRGYFLHVILHTTLLFWLCHCVNGWSGTSLAQRKQVNGIAVQNSAASKEMQEAAMVCVCVCVSLVKPMQCLKLAFLGIGQHRATQLVLTGSLVVCNLMRKGPYYVAIWGKKGHKGWWHRGAMRILPSSNFFFQKW